jgi:hypothetical protein
MGMTALFGRDAGAKARRRRAAKADLSRVFGTPHNVLAIHYSCESFYGRADGSSPRITSIAVRNLSSGQTVSFSIHQIAERDKKLRIEDIESNNDELEKKMLKEFYEYVDRNKHCVWLHWNMRDVNYGFAALAHRYKVLGGKDPAEIDEGKLADLARILVGLYGVGYIGHPRLARIVEKNSISKLGFLGGEEEAAAFMQKEYVKLHQSTLRKVDIIANLAERAFDGTLKTNAKRAEIYGGDLAYLTQLCQEHWLFAILAVAGSVASIVGLVFVFK